jgi:hypothetical protein
MTIPVTADQAAPCASAWAITPSDTKLDVIPFAVWVGTGGDLKFQGANSTADVILKNVPNGTLLPIRPEYVRASGTTAADIVALGH